MNYSSRWRFLRYIFVIIIIAFVMQLIQPVPPAYAIGGTWDEVTVGSATGNGVGTANSTYPFLRVDSNGFPNMSILNEASPSNTILFQRFDGVNWVGADGTPGADTVDAGMPAADFHFDSALVLANNNTPHVSWGSVSGVNERIFYRYWNGSAWVGLGDSDTNGLHDHGGFIDGFSSVAIHPITGNPYIAWDAGGTGSTQIYLRYWDGANWQALGNSNTINQGVSNTPGNGSFIPNVDIDENGNIYVTWAESGEIFVKMWNGANWVGPVSGTTTADNVSNNGPTSHWPDVDIMNGEVYVTWMENDSGPMTSGIYMRKYNGVAWIELAGSATGSGVSTFGGFAENQVPSISVARNGRPYIAYKGNFSGGTENTFVRYFDGVAWQALGNSQTVQGGISNADTSDEPSIAVAPNGQPFVAYRHCNPCSTFRVYIREFNTADAVPVLVNNNTLNATPSAATTIPTGLLNTTDTETAVGGLTYKITSSPTEGTLSLPDEFTQAQINSNSLTYTHSGATGADSFDFIVSDNYHIIGEYTFNINVSDPSGVTLSTASVNVTESGTTATFDVTLDSAPTANVTVNLAFATGAPNGAAISSPAPPFVIPSGTQGPLTLTVQGLDDSVFEGPHSDTITVSVSSGDGNYNGGGVPFSGGGGASNNEVAVNITDNDSQPTVNISPVNITQNEGDAGTTAYDFTVALTNGSTQVVTVNYTTNDGTATTGDSDYADNDGALTFNPGASLSQTITVNVNGDEVVELDEGFAVSLNSVNNGSMGTSSATGTITNDDSATLSIDDVTQVETDAGTTTFTFTVTLDSAVDTAVSVDYDSANSTATTADSDYVANTGNSLNFAGNLGEMQTLDITVNGDEVVELDETFFVNLSNISASGRDVTFADNQGLGTITNDDSATLSIDDVTQVETDAGTTIFTFTVSLDSAVDIGFTVDYDTADDTATTADSDYAANAGNSHNFAGNLGETQTLDVTVNGDDVVELDETFFVNLSNIQASGRDVTFADSQGVGTITNDDSATLSIDDITQVETDAGTTTFTFTVTLDNAVDAAFTVDHDTADNTATTADSDYIANTGNSLNFAGNLGETQTLDITVNSDEKVELDETFFVNLSNVSVGGRDVTINDGQGVGTITNDDSATLSIDDVTQAETDAGTTAFTFTVTLDSAIDTSFTVDYDSADNTATTADSDYAANTGNSLNFTGNLGETQTLDITVNGDEKVELDETFFVNLSNVLASGRDVTINAGQGVGTITNDDSATLSIDDVTQVEGDTGTSTFTFTVTLDSAVDTGISVDYDTADNTATTADSDYAANTGNSLNFTGNLGETQTLDITVNGDEKVELDETFFVNLSNVLASGRDVTFADSQGVGTITNDDSATVTINDVTQNEGDAGPSTFTFTVTLDNAVDTAFTVDYDSADNTATTADSDYTANTGNSLNFVGNLGETQTLDITVNGDEVVELDETFFVNLSNVLASGRNVTINDGQGVGTITNDDSATLTINDVTQNEGNAGPSSFTFTVTLDSAVDVGVSVDYDSADDTALVSDNDYDANTGNTLNFVGNASETQTLDITVNGDTETELDETFFVNLSNIVASGRAVSFGDNQGLGTILNDDAPPEASIAPPTISQVEGDCSITTQYTFTVTLDNNSSQVVTINYTTNDGTATIGDNDYGDNDGALVFNPGDPLTQDIVVSSNGDINFEGDENFTVTLNSATNGTIDAANDTSTGTITNDDTSVSNDKFCGATVVNSLPTTSTQPITDASVSPTDPTLGCAANYTQSVWFTHTATSDGLLYSHTSGSDYDTVLAVLTGTEGSFNVLACATGNIGTGRPSIAGVNMSNGATYHVMVAHLGGTPVTGNLSLTMQTLAGNDALAIFNPASSATELQTSVSSSPQPISFANTPPTNASNRWVMGDWNGDGVDSPGYFDSGAFRYTNDIGATSNWSTGFWLGNPSTLVGVVAGRFASGFANDTGNDCIGWVDSGLNGNGDMRFSLKYWCDMTTTPQSIGGTLSTQWLAAPLSNSQGFTGTFQFAYGDWDNDGLDEPGIRRSSRIVRSTNAPSEGAALYGAGMAQRWDTADGDGPGAHGLDTGLFVAGDWDGDGTDNWGVVYDDNTFYYRNVFGFNPGPFEFSSQTFTSSIAAPRQVASHGNASGGSNAPAPAFADGIGSGTATTVTDADGNPVDTNRNVEADLAVTKSGNYTVGEVGLVGDSIVWTITLTNTGTAPANGVQIIDNVPSELRVDDALANDGAISVRGQVVTFSIESIGVGETAQFQVVTTILSQPSSGLFNNSVNVLLPDGNSGGSDANLVASGTVESVDSLPATGYVPKLRW